MAEMKEVAMAQEEIMAKAAVALGSTDKGLWVQLLRMVAEHVDLLVNGPALSNVLPPMSDLELFEKLDRWRRGEES